MNASIRGIIDHMFKDTVINEETKALHEELLNNCLEHYDDLIARGFSETEAIDAVVDSLKGMKEVIDEYPKKPGREAEKQDVKFRQDSAPERTDASLQEETQEEKPSEYTFSTAEIRRLRTDLKNCDLKINVSPDDKIHVRCEDMDHIVCSRDGDLLTVRLVDKTRQSFEEASQKMNSQDFSVKGLLNFIGKAIDSVASNISISWNVYIDLPAALFDELDLNAKSGDINIRANLPGRLSIHNMSGDVDVEALDSRPASSITISSMSGDIEFTGNSKAIALSSMSGDTKANGIYCEADLKSTSGDVELDGEAEAVRMNSVSGDITAELHNTTVRTIQARSTSGEVEIILAPGTESVHASMSTVSGTARCSIPDSGHGANLQIQANSVSGDVTIR